MAKKWLQASPTVLIWLSYGLPPEHMNCRAGLDRTSTQHVTLSVHKTLTIGGASAIYSLRQS
jgi:hypothetical protein